MLYSGQVDGTGGKHAILVLIPGDEETVGSAEDGHGIFGKELALVKPGLAQVACQVPVLAKARIAVGRQHLGVGVDEDIRSLHLAEQLVESMQIVACDEDAVALYGSRPDLCWSRLAEGLYVGFLEELHGLDVHLARPHCQSQELLRVEIDIGQCGEETPLDEGIYLGIGIAQLSGVVEIGADAFDGEEQVILQTCHNRFLSTDAFQCAACAPGGLGALVAEHIRFFNSCHFQLPLDHIIINSTS